jgi:hypothetical protein
MYQDHYLTVFCSTLKRKLKMSHIRFTNTQWDQESEDSNYNFCLNEWKQYWEQNSELHESRQVKCYLTVGRANTEQTVLSWPVKAETCAFVRMSHTCVWNKNILVHHFAARFCIMCNFRKWYRTLQTESRPPVSKTSIVGWRARQ